MEDMQFNGIRRLIAEATLPGTSIQEIMQALYATDWSIWEKEAQERIWPIAFCRKCHHNFQLTLVNDCVKTDLCESCLETSRQATVYSCKRCGKSCNRQVYLDAHLVAVPRNFPSNGRWTERGYCMECIEKVIQDCAIHCVNCDLIYIPFKHKLFCGSCISEVNLYEMSRVSAHNARARELNLPATLTVKQWLSTLKYFNWLCAYCLAPYKGLEHYTPLSLGVGTTVNNCLPTCSKCNIRKKDKHPDDFACLFPAENIGRIKDYLTQPL